MIGAEVMGSEGMSSEGMSSEVMSFDTFKLFKLSTLRTISKPETINAGMHGYANA